MLSTRSNDAMPREGPDMVDVPVSTAKTNWFVLLKKKRKKKKEKKEFHEQVNYM